VRPHIPDRYNIRGRGRRRGRSYAIRAITGAGNQRTNEKGEKVVFGSVGGGGRYDGIVSRFMGQPVPATGFSIGVSRL
ncbi:ATP phosphoribosyltransferase regulatory subunit, partial [Rhizobium leguminosarum]|uniref:ATP phosphoribosyltransferase regulatory subunit n=1 Tax=Rhizobium leguminosarum TaxID=384 RepID=UPI003F9CA705